MVDEETTAVSPPQPAPEDKRPGRSTGRERRPEHGQKDRTPFWALMGVVVGFLLPACSCAFLLMTAVFSTSLMGASDAPRLTGVGAGDAVAIVRVEGLIVSGDGNNISGSAYSNRIIADLEAANADNSVKAIVLRVDSSGGSVTGSAEIWEKLVTIEKPIVVSMGGTAASGGYYVSAPADYIIARPDTLTGSLGVILTIYDASDLLNEIGIKVIDIASGENKTMGSLWSELTPEQASILQSIADEAFDDFVQVIVDGRSMSETDVRQLADGRVYSGRQAEASGLVDQLGNFQDAIDKAAELGGISGAPRLVEYTREPSWTEILIGFTSRFGQSEAERTMALINELTTPSLEYRYVGPLAR
jgi:protease IV